MSHYFDDSRRKLREDARKQIEKVQQENKKRYKQKRLRKAANKYHLDELVAIKCTQLGPGVKLRPKYLESYHIIKVKSNDIYDVEKIADAEKPCRTTTVQNI